MSDNMLKVVTLNNGRQVPEVIVRTTLLAAMTLIEDPANYLAAYDMVAMAKEPGYKPYGNNGDVLTRFGLLQEGTMHSDVRAVIDATYSFEGLSLIRRSPLAA